MGRVQPIAVTYADINDAVYFVEQARSLRPSHTGSVRQFIYISRDMTLAEAQAASDRRNQRRQKKQRNATTLVTAQDQVVSRRESHVTMTSLDMMPPIALRNRL